MEKWIAGITGGVGAIISYAIDGLGLAVVVLIGLMAIDYATGLIAAVVKKELNSRIGFNGLLRKVYYLLLIGAVYALALVIPDIKFAGDGLAIAMCVLEFVSIAENGTKINAPMPAFLKNILAIVKDKSGEGDIK